jgi:sulfur-carrier protein
MSSTVTVRYWAGARRAAGRNSEDIPVSASATLSEVLAVIGRRPELVRILSASSVLVDGVSSRPDQRLEPGAVVDILPPFAGG